MDLLGCFRWEGVVFCFCGTGGWVGGGMGGCMYVCGGLGGGGGGGGGGGAGGGGDQGQCFYAGRVFGGTGGEVGCVWDVEEGLTRFDRDVSSVLEGPRPPKRTKT